MSAAMKGDGQTASSEKGKLIEEPEVKEETDPKEKKEADPKQKINIPQIDALPETIVDVFDKGNTLLSNWCFEKTLFTREEGNDAKAILFRQKYGSYLLTEYEESILQKVETADDYKKSSPLTDEEKKDLSEKLSRVMKDANVKTDNPKWALIITSVMIVLIRMLPVLMNMIDRSMNKNSKPKREFGERIDQPQNKKAA